MSLPRQYGQWVAHLRYHSRLSSPDDDAANDKISFGAPWDSNPMAMEAVCGKRKRYGEGVPVTAHVAYADEAGAVLEIHCPLCYEIHTHVVTDDWDGEALRAPCGRGSYRVRL